MECGSDGKASSSNKEHVKQLKIAVALACLRNKPDNISGHDYTKQLCDSFKANQLRYKKKLQDANTEILHLKQQLVLQTNVFRDNLDVQQMSQENVLTDFSSQSIFPTPPASNQPLPMDTLHYDQVTSMANHTAFFHHVIRMQTASTNLSDKNIENVTLQSLLHSLDLLQQHLGKDDYSWRIQCQCAQSVVTLLDKMEPVNRELVTQKICTICEQITRLILSAEADSGDVQEKRVKLLMEFIGSNKLCLPILRIVCAAIQQFSNFLRSVLNENEDMNPCYFCNIYYILTVIDHSVGQSRRLEWSVDDRESIQTTLEECLLHLTQKFPLYAHAIWKIIAKFS